MSDTHITVAQRDRVLTIWLDRPDVLNSVDARMAEELVAVIERAAADDEVRALLLTGNGRAFCAGQDLAEVLPREGAPPPDLGDVVERQYIAKRLAGMPTRALGLTKRAFNAGLHGDLESQLALEAQLQREAGATEDYAEGVRAFVEKRKPHFRGR